MCTHPPTPRAKVLQRVGDDLHAITKHAIQIEFLVLVYHGRQEEDQAAAGLQEIPCEGDEVDCECGQLVRFSGWHIRLVIPRNGQIMSDDCSDMGVRTHARDRGGTEESASRTFLRPRRFAPARTPSIRNQYSA